MLVSLCALGCYGVWVWAPDWVLSLDTQVIESYAQKADDRFKASAGKIHRDRAAGIAELSALVEEWADYRYGDRQERLAQRALLHLVRTYANSGEYTAATEALEKHIDLMGGDLSTRAKLYDYMAKVPGRRAEALAGLQRAHQEFPMHHYFCAPLAKLLAEEGRVGEGWEVHTTTFRRSQSNIWKLLWLEPRRENRNMYVRLVPRATKNGFVLSTELPLGATELRIRPSIHAYSQYQELKVSLEWPHGRLEVPLSAEALDGIRLTDGVYRITSERPMIKFAKIREVRAAIGVLAHVRLKLTIEGVGGPVPSPEMARYGRLHGPALRSIADERGDAAMTALVNIASENALLGLSSDFYWCGKGTDFSSKRRLPADLVTKKTKDGTSFTSEFSLDVTANQIRFDLPDVPSTFWQITKFELYTSEGVIHLGAQTPKAAVRLELVDGFYRAIGNDPYLVYRLGKEVKLKSVRVSGIIR